MSKKYKGKPCVYCGDYPATTGDHVFARAFFLEQEKTNLIQVPACEKCNNEKAKLEHYLTAILPFGRYIVSADEQLYGKICRRLSNNKLLDSIRVPCVHTDNDFLSGQPSHLSVPFDDARYRKLFRYIVKALVWHHWGERINENTFISVEPDKWVELSEEVRLDGVSRRVVNSVGDDTFRYIGLELDRSQDTLWHFRVLNGLKTCAVNEPGLTFDCIKVSTFGR